MPNFPGPLKNLNVITEDGQIHSLMGTALHFVYLDGAGMAPIRRILEKAPLQHGASDRGFRLDPRSMILHLYIEGTDERHADGLRDRIAYLFGPTNSPLQLRATRDDGAVRQIDCYVDGEVDFPMSQRVGNGQPVVIPLLAPDPIWYDPVQQVTEHTITNGTTQKFVSVSGLTWDDWPVIDLTGPMDAGFLLQHTPGDEVLVFSQAIPSGETFRLDLRPGYKSIQRTSDNANRMSFIDPNYLHAFADMRILAEKTTRATHPLFTNTNVFTFDAAGTSGASKATIYWYKRYLSL
ncbi:MAG: hypothetical protein UZ13_01514 [Chloroflexi bacterium OLB13]|nr:MAG: hypothetical protein UZ13_01514 [Chloroflexi bacterium OLB13]RIK36781.1 MAG: hypothetical protein DCC55_26280 [Chloroflexota bacterium]